MKKIIRLISLSAIILLLNACQVFSPQTAPDAFSPEYEITEHPLIDKIWSVKEQQFISQDTLNKRILENNIILLGETHDNARHHQLQAEVIAFLTKNKQSPAVAFEMLNQDQQATINDFQQSHYHSTEKNTAEKTALFAQQINWEKSGWPEWQYYQPIFYNAIDQQLPIIAANLDTKTIRKVIKEGDRVLAQNYQALLEKHQYDEALKKELEQEIFAAHCDMLPEKMLAPMLRGQQTRDLAMLQSILKAVPKDLNKDDPQQVLALIAGSGHTRTDYGVPYYLHQEAPALSTLSLSFIEVREDKLQPGDYAKAWRESAEQLPFDYVKFTPKAVREDQCAKMKAYMKMKKHMKEKKAEK